MGVEGGVRRLLRRSKDRRPASAPGEGCQSDYIWHLFDKLEDPPADPQVKMSALPPSATFAMQRFGRIWSVLPPGYVTKVLTRSGRGPEKRREIQPRCDLRATAVAVDSRYGPGYRRPLSAGAWATTNKTLRLAITGENEEEQFRTPQ